MILAVAACFSVTAAFPAEAGTTKYMGSKYTAKKKHKSSRRAGPQPDRYAHIVIDAQSGYVLSEKNPDKHLYPASLTKMMTLYLTFEAIETGALTKYKRVPVSTNAQYQPPSKLGLEAGYSMRVEDAILALVTRSANDAAVVLADAVGGSESRFARLMTQKAAALGMRHTRFANASGLHEPEQYSSARDMAILSQALMRDYPRYYRYFSTPSFVYAGVTSLNHNKLMATYAGMDGIKTGYVNASGYNLAASAVQDGKRLIGIVFGGRTSASRNSAMKDLLDAGFRRMAEPRVATAIQKRLDAARALLPRKKPERNIASNSAVKRIQPVTSRTQSNLDAPAFSPLGMSTEEGDAQEQQAAPQRMNKADDPVHNVLAEFKPRPMNTAILAVPPPKKPQVAAVAKPVQVASAAQAVPAFAVTPDAVKGTWAVQIGAFANQQAGMAALKNARDRLPQKLTTGSQYIIAPLQTNRGTIYRARLAGMNQSQATSACKMLQANCLVMAVQ